MTSRIDKRNLLSSFFITLLIGIAFQEMISTIKGPIIADGMNINNSFLGLTFFFISIRYFIGNQLHLFSESFLKLPGILWLYDLIVIIVQSTILIFLGNLCTVPLNFNVQLGFLEFIVILLSLDVFWICSQWFMGKIVKKWERNNIPWIWAILNFVLIIAIVLIERILDNAYSNLGLTLLLIANLVAFVIDVILIDYYDAI